MEYKVKTFKELILAENKRQNLVSRRDPEREVDKHIQDSLAIFDIFSLSGKRLIDIGSGGGFPGLVLAILSHDTKITLVEADKKKGEFLLQVKRALNLENAEILIQRAEEVGHEPEYRERYDLCTSRAVAPVRVLLEYSLPLIKTGGLVVMWKGKNCGQEIIEAENAMTILGAGETSVYKYNLMDELDRSLVVVEKVMSTPQKYPRRVGVPGKRPL